jgi:hypothetical protein
MCKLAESMIREKERVLTDICNFRRQTCKKFLLYKDLTIEIQRVWNVKTKVIPVIIGAAGTISQSFRKYLSNILGKNEIKELQKQPYLEFHTYFIKY